MSAFDVLQLYFGSSGGRPRLDYGLQCHGTEKKIFWGVFKRSSFILYYVLC
jgi:hypothetical protein